MFAVFRTGGKQYKVAKNDIIRVETVPGSSGDLVEFTEVLMVGDGAQTTVGKPLVAGATVAATLVDQIQADKVIIFKKKRRHNYRRKRGHRQPLSLLRVVDILTDGKTLDAAAKDAAKTAAQASIEKNKSAREALATTTGARRKAPTRKPAAKAAPDAAEEKKSAGKKPAARKKAASKKSKE
jgi:large subunit ribosomal protein L21